MILKKEKTAGREPAAIFSEQVNNNYYPEKDQAEKPLNTDLV